MNSCRLSVAGTGRLMVDPVAMLLLSTPLITMEFDVARWPFTVNTASPRPSSVEFGSEPEAPADRVRSC